MVAISAVDTGMIQALFITASKVCVAYSSMQPLLLLVPS